MVPRIDRNVDIFFPDGEDQWIDLAVSCWHRGGYRDAPGYVKEANNVVVYRDICSAGEISFYFKYFRIRDVADWIKHLVRPSRAMRTFQNERKFMAQGFSTPRVLCIIEEKILGFPIRSGHVSEAMDHLPSAWSVLEESASKRDVIVRRKLLDALAEEIGSMHRANLYHGDMNFTNMLCDTSDAQVKFVWIDNERTQQFKNLPSRMRVRNLNQMNREQRILSRTERMRFFNRYCDCAGVAAEQRRNLARKVLLRGQRKKRSIGTG